MKSIEKYQKKNYSNLDFGDCDSELYFWIIELFSNLHVLRKRLAADDD